jgi:hypothetical protein
MLQCELKRSVPVEKRWQAPVEGCLGISQPGELLNYTVWPIQPGMRTG